MMWRATFAAMLVSMVAVLSAFPAAAAVAFYPRIALVGLLALVTWGAAPTRERAPLKGSTLAVVSGMWWLVAVSAATTLWSIDRVETLTQTALLACLTAIVHGSAARRWTTVDDVVSDLAIGFWIVAGAAAASLAAYAVGLPGSVDPQSGRLHGIFANPNMLAALAAVTLPIGVALLRRRVTVWRLAAIAGMAIAMLLTESRTAALAGLVALGWLTLRTSAKYVVPAVCIVTLIGASWAMAIHTFRAELPTPGDLDVVQRFTQPVAGGLLNTRDVIWAASLDLWAQHPVGGVGYGAAPTAMASIFHETSGYGFTIQSVHSGYLQWLLETGIVGAIVLGVLLLVVLGVVTRARGAAVPLAAALATGLAIQVTESALLGTGQPFPYVFWLAAAGCALAADERRAAAVTASSGSPARPQPRRRSRAG